MSTAQIHIERNDRQIPVDVESDDITMGFSEEGEFPLTAEEQEWAAAEFRSQNDMTAVFDFMDGDPLTGRQQDNTANAYFAHRNRH